MDLLYEKIHNMKIIDAHEHMYYKDERKKMNADFFHMLHYLESDMITAGMPYRISTSEIEFDEKIDIFLDYYNKTKNTSYAKAIKIFAKDLYGIDKIDKEGIYELNRMIKEKNDDPNWYEFVLKKRANINILLVIDGGSFNPPYYAKSLAYLDFLMQKGYIEDVINRKRNEGVSKFSFDDYLEHVHNLLQKFYNNGIIGYKFGLPYWRDLDIKMSEYEEARYDFEQNHFSKRLENYIFHHIMNFILEHNLPIQVHTGHVEPCAVENGYQLSYSDVTNFLSVVNRYKDIKFILLHTGFPYQNQYLSIAKNTPNVYVDFTWIHLISPSLSNETLSYAIELIPQNKIIGFGGDFMHVENIYSHSVITREVIYNTLKQKIQQGYMDIEEAIEFAQNILYNNPISIYNL
ncbi:amidohydrolase family protein [Caldicellulosiruptoraceae bacterium PP1]